MYSGSIMREIESCELQPEEEKILEELTKTFLENAEVASNTYTVYKYNNTTDFYKGL